MPAPVAYTIGELCQQNLVEVLSSISTYNSYLSDLTVEVVKQGGNPPLRDGLALVGFGTPKPQDGAPVQFEEFLMPVGVCIYIIQSEKTSDPAILRQRLTAAAGDVRRALLLDRHRGGNAVNTEFPDPDELHETNSPPMVIVWPNIRYRHLMNDPYRRF